MPAQTPIYGIPYPIGTDPITQGDKQIKALAERVETVMNEAEIPLPAGSDPTPPAVCKLIRTSAQACANATDVPVTWQSAAWDSQPGGQAQYSNAGFVCRKAGIYRITAFWPWGGNNATGRRNMKITLNSTSPASAIMCDAMNGTTWENCLSASDEVALAVGDTVRMIVAQDSGGSLTGGKGSNAATALTGAMSFVWLRAL
ncbi:hypothetical protein [Gordonia sp. CPCC 205333]|uniref:hypothetical protein n=1 Tax=Gordonia sp. CPCC 205333 TaxID=3140790 RepID=UPI003AF3D4D1